MRPVTVTVGPLAAASANNIATSQSLAAAGQIALNGTLASAAFTGTGAITGNSLNVTTSSAGAIAQYQTLNGLGLAANTVVTGPPAQTGVFASYVISPSQTVASETLYGNAVATLDKPRRVLITSAGNDAGITFTVTGNTFGNTPVTEVVTGVSAAAVATVTDFATVTSILTSGSTASTVTVGTNGVAGSPWFRFDDYAPAPTSLECVATGTVNYTVQTSNTDPNINGGTVTVPGMSWISSLDTNVVGSTISAQSYFAYAPVFGRVLLNSGTGTLSATFTQSGVTPV
jgi:hypothetical protein